MRDGGRIRRRCGRRRTYPKYRGKNHQINTMEDRINGCFTYSMNAPEGPAGGPPPEGDQIYKDLEA